MHCVWLARIRRARTGLFTRRTSSAKRQQRSQGWMGDSGSDVCLTIRGLTVWHAWVDTWNEPVWATTGAWSCISPKRSRSIRPPCVCSYRRGWQGMVRSMAAAYQTWRMGYKLKSGTKLTCKKMLIWWFTECCQNPSWKLSTFSWTSGFFLQCKGKFSKSMLACCISKDVFTVCLIKSQNFQETFCKHSIDGQVILDLQ